MRQKKCLTTEEFNRFTDDSVVFSHLTDNPDDLMSAILDPDKYDAMVAIASDLRAAYPKLWKKNKKTIDNLFDLTINKDLDFIDKESGAREMREMNLEARKHADNMESKEHDRLSNLDKVAMDALNRQ